ncbi:16S rRNA (cytidine(1402)-2'-O)-methyltransferase [Nitratireductor sp. XY-223]|uniref:16S rRNA (cytidine(1402)-2'-O)-methyltransferase n=1 Tax=Nitratireductor sp. XY-223 TaxID=2561926 RepID=UPI0010AA8987|nr:16S rRNA (cytidine(1402)-2'-O)-methyltransferase [Nitratireductor sp. XY-223]
MQGSFQIGAHAIPAGPLEPALYLVATPIGNLADITLRALQVLASADILACEDTRVTRTLLSRYAIANRPVAYHEHNAARAGPKLVAALKEGKSVALVSDAGTPLVSDPGYRLVELALEDGITVIPVPGASAPLAALVASGLPSDSFHFAGFLPARDKARRDRLDSLKDVPATLVLFESPRRLAAALAAAADVLGAGRSAAVCRELTKAFEEIRRAPLGELARHYAQADTVKGEIVLVIGPPADEPASPEDADALLLELLKSHAPGKAATEAAQRTGLPRKALYQRLLSMKDAAP